MHLTYNAINSQYAVKQSLPLGGDLEGFYAVNAKELDEENNKVLLINISKQKQNGTNF